MMSMADRGSNSGAFPLPLQIEEIDAEWLTRALRSRAPGVTVNGVETVNMIRGTCTKIRLQLDLDDAGKRAGIPERVILKGGFEPHSRVMSHMHQSEVFGYRDLYTVLNLPVPACYFADYDEERQQGIVIMDDLTARGVEFCSALKPVSFEAAARRLSVLARFHAQTWDTPREGGRWSSIRETEPGLREYMRQYLDVPEEWRRFVGSPRGAATSAAFHDVDVINTAFDRLVAFSRGLPQCVIHGDSHPGNLFVHADGSPGFFDSLPGRAPSMREIAYYIGASIDLGDRRRWEGALLQHYLDQLRANGVTPAGFDETLEQYAAYMLAGYIIFLVNESFYQTESVNTAIAARFSAAMVDHDTLRVLERLDRNSRCSSH
jgi:hypothetical protein